MNGILVDTNVLVYAHDARDPKKQRHAIDVLDALHATGQGRLSVQVLAEFFAATTRGQRPLLKAAQAARQVENLSLSWTILDLTSWIVTEAIRGVRVHGFSYWDAQVWATARSSQLAVVLTEDFGPSSTIEGVRFVNPLEDGFELGLWL